MEFSETRYFPSTNSYSATAVEGSYNLKGPLNVGFQITRRCNLKCTYCSETPNNKELSMAQIEYGLRNLKSAGVLKVNLTGGEPLLRRELVDIVDMSKEIGLHVAIDSNAALMTKDIASMLNGKLAYFESTIDGSKVTHNTVRGCYDKVIDGITIVADTTTPVYIASVLVNAKLDDMKSVLLKSHELGVKGVKYLTPIPKARGNSVPEEFRDAKRYSDIWQNLLEFKYKEGLTPVVSIADWNRIGRGSVILINSDGEMVGSPSIGEDGCVTKIGNLLEQSVEDIWKNYPYKDNHIKKYLGITMPISK